MVFASHVHIDERVINIDCTPRTCVYIYVNTGKRISRALVCICAREAAAA